MNVNVNIGASLAAESASNAARDGGLAEGEIKTAVVKWFREDKGYGFVDLPDGRGDAFLHAKTLRSLGLETIAPGATVRVQVEMGPRGRQVGRLIDVDVSTAATHRAQVRPSRALSERPVRDHASAIELTGKVKWFDESRGFGFVACDDFGRDAFVHCSILGGLGAAQLATGQPVKMRVIENPKGREAIEITL